METQNTSNDVNELIVRLKKLYGIDAPERELKNKATRFVIYARKSTDKSENQERSIPDQISACRELVTKLGLGMVPVIHEERSAKMSDNRPKFRAMINDILRGTL